MSEQDKLGAFSDSPSSSQFEHILSSQDNNFQSVSNVTPLDSKPHHTIDFPHPDANPIAPPPSKYPHDDQGSKVGMGVMSSFFCCAFGWTLFVLGFILLTIPWYVGAIIYLIFTCFKLDNRDKYGYVACFIAVCLVTLLRITRESCPTFL